MKPRILVVGCGLTGSAVRHFLSQSPSLGAIFTFWESNSTLGGRMLTDYSDVTGLHCDLGAQYLTVNSEDPEILSLYESLNAANIISPLKFIVDGMKPEHLIRSHFVAPGGFSSLVGYMSGTLSDSGDVEVEYDTTLKRIDFSPTNANKIVATGTKVSTSPGASAGHRRAPQSRSAVDVCGPGESAVQSEFDGVVLTIPPPQLLAVEGDIKDTLGDTFRSQLAQVRFSSRYALCLYYPPSSWDALKDVAYGAKYVFDDDIVRYVSIENHKSSPRVEDNPTSYGSSSSDTSDRSSKGPAMLVHTSIPFGIENQAVDHGVVIEKIMGSVNRLYPGLGAPVDQRLVYWRESQVSGGLKKAGFEGDAAVLVPGEVGNGSGMKPVVFPGAGAGAGAGVVSNPVPGGTTGQSFVVLAGDSFTESNFEGCVKSARAAAAAINALYDSPSQNR